jgi:hypothetical protein
MNNIICSLFGHSYIETGTQYIMICSRCGNEYHLKLITDYHIHKYPDGKIIIEKKGEE